MKVSVLLSIFLASILATCVTAQPGSDGTPESTTGEHGGFTVTSVATGFSRPWGMAFLPDGRLLVTERTGALKLVSTGGDVTDVSGVPDVAVVGQGGLLDVILDPNFATNRWVYLSHAFSRGGQHGTAVVRAELSGTQLENVTTIFEMDSLGRTGRHFGSRFAFLGDGTLLFTIGDRGERSRAQSLSDHGGSTLRINTDGTVPQDNPFVGRSGAKREIYTYGNRNAQGMTVHPETGVVWQHEHGPRGGDEINIIEAGNNYGWPVITYGEEYSGGEIGGTEAPGMEQPVIHWTPSIAPSGMEFYTGDQIPEWQGDLFVGALAGQHLRRVVVDGTEVVEQEVLLDGEVGRVRDVETGPDGYLYLITDASSGTLYRLEPAE
jgi:glucose/arabinose dehydrogenase